MKTKGKHRFLWYLLWKLMEIQISLVFTMKTEGKHRFLWYLLWKLKGNTDFFGIYYDNWRETDFFGIYYENWRETQISLVFTMKTEGKHRFLWYLLWKLKGNTDFFFERSDSNITIVKYLQQTHMGTKVNFLYMHMISKLYKSYFILAGHEQSLMVDSFFQ